MLVSVLGGGGTSGDGDGGLITACSKNGEEDEFLVFYERRIAAHVKDDTCQEYPRW